MMKSLMVAMVLLSASASAAAAGDYYVSIQPIKRPEGYEKVNVSKATIGDAPIRLWANTSIEPDCTPHGKVSLTVLRQPEHGQVVIDSEPFYLAFGPNNPRSACNQQKIPGNQAIYTAAEGYHGRDHLVLEGFNPDGHVRRISVDIDVR